MNFLGITLASLIIAFIITFMVAGDELIESTAQKYVDAGTMCLEDPNCFMSFEDYQNFVWGMRILNEKN